MPLKYTIIGTAGHVDHGKSALIERLTGTDPDRWTEEKERGITIDLGFASFRLPSGTQAGVVDVPGHERFVHNMLAGIGGIDLVLLVVDAQEGVMPQTREHLQILQQLEIQSGVLVLTKVDLVEEDWCDVVEEEVREALQGTFLADAPCCRVSSVSGQGIDDLLKAIETELKEVTPRDPGGPMRLPIDRHFTLKGFGTVITGTLMSGTVTAGDSLELGPGGESVRVREVQVHGKQVQTAQAGQRVALNLSGVERSQLQRGCVLGTPGYFQPTERFDARVSLLSNAPRPLKTRDPIHLFLGTARTVGRVVLLDRDRLEPGESTLAQIQLDQPLMAGRGDRFILRSYSPMLTIGGGRVIEASPERHKRFRPEVTAALEQLEAGGPSLVRQTLAQRPALTLKEMDRLTGLGPDSVQAALDCLESSGQTVNLTGQWATIETVRSWRATLEQRVTEAQEKTPLTPGVPRAELKSLLPDNLAVRSFDALLTRMVEDDRLTVRDDWCCRPGWQPQPTPEQAERLSRIETAYREDGGMAKNKTEMLDRLGIGTSEAEECLVYLFATGRLVRLSDESFFHIEAYRYAQQQLVDHFAGQPTLTLAQFRDRIGSARKQTQALLEHFDGLKYTQRRGDERVAWKLPSLSDG